MCSKRKYSKRGASYALMNVIFDRIKNDPKDTHIENRKYFCRQCQAWHLTSHDDNETIKLSATAYLRG